MLVALQMTKSFPFLHACPVSYYIMIPLARLCCTHIIPHRYSFTLVVLVDILFCSGLTFLQSTTSLHWSWLHSQSIGSPKFQIPCFIHTQHSTVAQSTTALVSTLKNCQWGCCILIVWHSALFPHYLEYLLLYYVVAFKTFLQWMP